jgi:hypothetical protein
LLRNFEEDEILPQEQSNEIPLKNQYYDSEPKAEVLGSADENSFAQMKNAIKQGDLKHSDN